MATAVQEFRQEEKSVLAKELGLTTLQSHYAQVQELTGLKFPRITRAEVEHRIYWHLWQHPKGYRRLLWCTLPLLIGILALTQLIPYGVHEDAKSFFLFMGTMLCLAGGLGGLLVNLGNVTIEREDATDWSYGFPYGALLAMKEAKEQKIGQFHVWYPARMQWDPIVTGITKQGARVLIFEWIDGEVYTT